MIDAATGDDITRLILTQIIVEDAKAPNSSFPLDLLRQMVVASGRASQASQESALKYMRDMFDLYQNTYRVMTPPLNPFEFFQNLDKHRENSGEGKEPQNSDKSAKTEFSQGSKPADSEEVKELKSRLAELEKLVTKLVQH